MIYFFRWSYCWLLKLISNCLTNLGSKWGCDLVNVGIRYVCVCMNGVRRFVFCKITYVCLCGCYCTSYTCWWSFACVCLSVCVLLENAVFLCFAAMVYSHYESAGDLADWAHGTTASCLSTQNPHQGCKGIFF